MSEEGCGLNHHEHDQAEQHEEESDQEAEEAELRGIDTERDHGDVDKGGENSPKGLTRHHAPHVVRGKFPRHSYQAALEDCCADVQQDHYEERGQEEG